MTETVTRKLAGTYRRGHSTVYTITDDGDRWVLSGDACGMINDDGDDLEELKRQMNELADECEAKCCLSA